MKSKIIALALIVAAVSVRPVYAETDGQNDTAVGEMKEFHIENTEQFLEMSRLSRSESYTKDAVWILECDVDLTGQDFAPIGIFGGTLEGNGHTISGLRVEGAGSNQGLFRFVGEQAVVRNLTVEGEVEPSGSANQVGGIAGTNLGLVENCRFLGRVEGNLKTGGIAGYNKGIIRGCINEGQINAEESAASGEEKDSGDSVDTVSIKDAVRTEKINDAGGIAGFSEGIIENCTNTGIVGRPQTGYNLGGIVGRQNGIVRGCANEGTVKGRKDVGGIVGQMEPHVSLRYEEDTFQALQKQMEDLSDLAGDISDTVDSTGDRAETDIDRIGDSLDGLRDEAGNQREHYRDEAENWRNDMGKALDSLEDILDGLELEPSDELSDQAREIRRHVREARKLLEEIRENPFDTEKWEELKVCSEEIWNGIKEYAVLVPEEVTAGLWALSDDMENIVWRLEDILDICRTQADILADDLDVTKEEISARTDQISTDIDVFKNGLKENKSTLRGQKERLKNQIEAMEDTISQGMDRLLEDDELITDLSGDLDSAAPSGVISCENRGLVEADFQAGGIAGILGMELEGDPELDVDTVGERSLNSVREIRATVALCRNESDVNTKRDHAGGIVGKAGAGALLENENYGDVRAEEGDYVGGIAGSSEGRINGNYVFCRVFGRHYTGGIAGFGSDLNKNRAMVTVETEEDGEWRGSIAGKVEDEGEVSENIFLENGLGAVDGITYTEEARAVSYEEMELLEGLPAEFKVMKVCFLAEGKLVKEIDCSYGGAVEEKDIPKVPEKEGFEGTWENTELKDIQENLRVHAVYTPWRTAVASEEGNAPLLIAEGKFHNADRLEIHEIMPGELEGVEIPKGFQLVSAYRYELPACESGDVRLHLRVDEPSDRTKVGVCGAGGRCVSLPDAVMDGDYLVFEAESQGTLMILQASSGPAAWILIGLIGLTVFICLVKKKLPSIIALKKYSGDAEDEGAI